MREPSRGSDPPPGARHRYEIDEDVLHAGAGAKDGDVDERGVVDLVSEQWQDDGDLDRLAVLVALVVLECVEQRPDAEGAVAGLDVLEAPAA